MGITSNNCRCKNDDILEKEQVEVNLNLNDYDIFPKVNYDLSVLTGGTY